MVAPPKFDDPEDGWRVTFFILTLANTMAVHWFFQQIHAELRAQLDLEAAPALLVISNGRTPFDVGRLRTGHLAALWTPPFGHFWALRARSRWPSLAATTGRQTEALRYHLVCWYYGWFYGGHAPATEHVTLALCNGERRVQLRTSRLPISPLTSFDFGFTDLGIMNNSWKSS